MNGNCGEMSRRPLRIEVCLSNKCKVKKEEIKRLLLLELLGREVSGCDSTEVNNLQEVVLQQNVVEVLVVNPSQAFVTIDQDEMRRAEMCMFKLRTSEAFNEEMEEGGVVAEVTDLPNAKLHPLWNSLTYADDIKQNLLEYARTAMLFSDCKVDVNIINWNRIILLHGPPGTGKTSLCRALAHKLSIIMSNRYKECQLFEVNSHSLFSKWFSESGKLVMRMFQRVKEIVVDPNVLICVLIDEVESLSGSREGMSSNEPSDSIRVVNALLTQLDSLKKHNNVMVIATSNLSKNIDPAFIDRVDLMQYIGFPDQMSIYHILHSCICELTKSGIILTALEDKENIPESDTGADCSQLLDLSTLQLYFRLGKTQQHLNASTQHLLNIAQMSEGMSGRSLRKVPFIAHALYLQRAEVSVADFMAALEKAVCKHKKEVK